MEVSHFYELLVPHHVPRYLVVDVPALLLVTLVGLWAALSRRHRGLRATVVVGVAAVIVPTRAYDFILFILLLDLFQFVLVASYRRVMSWWQGRSTAETAAIERNSDPLHVLRQPTTETFIPAVHSA